VQVVGDVAAGGAEREAPHDLELAGRERRGGLVRADGVPLAIVHRAEDHQDDQPAGDVRDVRGEAQLDGPAARDDLLRAVSLAPGQHGPPALADGSAVGGR
jgi:hypothetical protein